MDKEELLVKTRMTELFGIKHPIVLAGMNWITEPKMVSAVCNAGGLGILAIAHFTPEEARRQIREVKELTDKPFGINQILVSPTAKENLKVAIEEKVPVINYSLGRPEFIERVHEYGGKVIGTVALVRHAMRAEQFGVDAITITGHEAAAHGGRATSLVLIPLVASKVKVPIIAAGGFYDGRGLAAALSLGADAISMGTRFATTKESVLHEHWKQIVLKATEQDTLYLEHEIPTRVLKTKKSEEEMKGGFPILRAMESVLEIKRLLKLSWWKLIGTSLSARKTEGGMGMREQLRYAANAARADKVYLEGAEEAGIMDIGQIIGGIEDIPSCQEVIERTVAEAAKVLEATLAKTRA
ncbi:NAD(P)H-dependent flavin oxidoreductase [Chloroflexota bacterium]